jgi:hypothetical protein
MRRRYLIIDASSVTGLKAFDRTTVGAEVVGCVMMIEVFGGPWAFPSCATARVVAVDARTRKVTIAYLMIIFPRVQQYAAPAT